MKRMIFCALLLSLSTGLIAQREHQNVRGTVIDSDSRQPLIGATVIVVDSDPLLGTTTDVEGRFTISAPTGRLDLQVRMLGFEEQRLSDLLLGSAKELVLTIRMQSSLTELTEFEVTAPDRKGELKNDMVTLSARRIGVEETSRIAGGINDPARMVSTFPGVAGDASGDNTIIVRGNSPKGVLWRLEGMEIPNPNHFADDGSTGGPINVLNSDMLDNSEFYTGAFAAEYGNATSAVFDMRLRDGNDAEREYTFKLGVLGTDLTAEGPIPGVKGGSYLANYRYSTLALLDGAGIVDYQGVPKYSDAAFKLKLPTNTMGTFALFGLGGKSHIIQNGESVSGDTLISRADFGSKMGILGLSHTRTLGRNSFIYSTVSLSGNGSATEYDESDAPGETPLERKHSDELSKWTIRVSSVLNSRLSARHKLRTGLIVANEHFLVSSSSYDNDLLRTVTELDDRGEANTLQAFSSWKWRMSEKFTMTTGVHLLHYALNGASSVEPRIGLKYRIHPGRAVAFAAGLHSRTEPIMTYLGRTVNEQGNEMRANKDLGLTKAAHLVLGYEHMLTEDIQFKAEAYYQHLFDVPVENDPNSSLTLANSSEWFTTTPLVNKGQGRNVGMELALEKFFSNGYHFMLTTSVSESTNKAMDGVWRNSRFNLGVVANALAGKEWKIGPVEKDRVFTTAFRYSVLGGQYRTPIDLEASQAAGEQVDGDVTWSEKGDPIHKVDVMLAYRVGRKKVGHELKVDVQNVMNASTAVYTYYDERSGKIQEVPQLAILPVIMYTLRF